MPKHTLETLNDELAEKADAYDFEQLQKQIKEIVTALDIIHELLDNLDGPNALPEVRETLSRLNATLNVLRG